MVRAYLGDTVVFRLLQTMTNESMVWTLSGHTYLTERYAGDANRKNSIHVGIAERYDLVVPQAGGPRLQAGDYIHFNGRSSSSRKALGIGASRISGRHGSPEVACRIQWPERNSGRPRRYMSADAPVKSFNVSAIDFPSMKLKPEGAGCHRGRLRADHPDGQSLKPRSMSWMRMWRWWRPACSRCR